MAAAEVVFDASVAAKVFITEPDSAAARALAGSGVALIAPDLVLAELTHIAVKRCRSGQITRPHAEAMIAAAPSLFTELTPTSHLADRALVLALDCGLSGYDATYLALAEKRGCDLVTADLQLLARASSAGLAIHARQP
jgi:predicted nucleic acid-binding protein